MTPDTVLIILLAAVAAGAPALLVWLRAQKRIRDLEMTLLTRTTDMERYEELRLLIEQLAQRTDQLVDQQALLAARLGDRPEMRLLPRPEQLRPITPH